MNSKICTLCQKEYPATKEYFYANKMGRHGLASRCKKCCLKIAKGNYEKEAKRKSEWYENNKERAKTSIKAHYERNKEEYLQKFRDRYVEKRDEYRSYARRYYKLNKEQIKQKTRSYYLEYREEVLLKQKQYRQKNADKIAAYFKDYEQTPERQKYMRIARARRKATKDKLPATLTAEQWNDCLVFFNNACAYCGVAGALQQEHFIPVVNNGAYTKDNIIPACSKCNNSKKATDFFDWYPKQEFYSQLKEGKILDYLNEVKP